eukprot:6361346-Lingulodinium_polyedra.AAC.1
MPTDLSQNGYGHGRRPAQLCSRSPNRPPQLKQTPQALCHGGRTHAPSKQPHAPRAACGLLPRPIACLCSR